jgi:hypothetical protein
MQTKFLALCYHDVPVDEPELIKALHREYYKQFQGKEEARKYSALH